MGNRSIEKSAEQSAEPGKSDNPVKPLRIQEADNVPCDSPAPFARELERLINRYLVEQGSNTPDFILAKYLCNCLDAFNLASREREKWYGKELRIGGVRDIQR